MTATMQTGTAVATSTLQASHTTGVVALPDTTPILAKYLDQLLNGETGDGRFVRVPASKEFYVFVTETVLSGIESSPTRRGQTMTMCPKPPPLKATRFCGKQLRRRRRFRTLLNRKKGEMRVTSLAISVALVSIAGCASRPESVTTEHKGKVTIVHHQSSHQ